MRKPSSRPVLYSAELQLPADISDVCPSVLPPLRSDSPTLVVGRMTRRSPSTSISPSPANRGGQEAGDVAVKVNEAVLARPIFDNYFLVGLVDQWAKAKETPAVLRADRTLTFAFEQTRLQHMEYLESAQLALEDGKLDAAHRLFKQVQTLSPDDGQAAAGMKIVDRLKDGNSISSTRT